MGDSKSVAVFGLMGISLTVYSKQTKEGKQWYYQFMENGTYHRGGGCNTKREAQEQEVEVRRSPSHVRKMAFGEVCDKYLTYIRSRGQSGIWINDKKTIIKKQFSKWYLTSIDEVTPNIIERHMFERAKRVSNLAANRDLKILKTIFNYSVKNQMLSVNPTEMVGKLPEEERVKYIPSVEDFLKVLTVAKPMEQRLLILLSRTAARISEILNLQWSDIRQDCVILKSRKHKGGMLKERKIPLSPDAKEAIEWLRSLNGEQAHLDKHLFLNRRTGRGFLRRPKLMGALCRKAGIKPFGFHSIRHLGASLMSKGMVPLKDIGKYLGHAKITTTDRYIQTLEDSLSGVARGLDEALR